jgi:tetratricopeptide (TPR) repeat protein
MQHVRPLVSSRLGGHVPAALAGLVALAVAWPAGDADAQKPRYTRNSAVSIKVKQTDRTRALAPKEGPKQAQPELTADAVLSIEGAVGDIRREQVQLLEGLIEETPDSEAQEKADLYFRLAELHAMQHRYWRLKGTEFAIKADTAKKPADKTKWKKESEAAQKKAKDSLLASVKVYKALAENDRFKNYPKMDQALFYYAYTLQGGKYMKEARQVFHRLIKDYPNSKFIPEAYLAFADYYFQQNSLANAEQFYDKVLQYPKSQVYTYAMYMKGWVYLNLARHQDALEIFFKVSQMTKGDKKKEILNRAAKKDFVRAYAEVGKAQTAFKAFERVDKDYAFTMLTILGDLYLEQGKAEKAIYTYREMIGMEPKNKNVCLWQYNVAHAMLTVGSNPQKVEEIEKLVKLYGALKDKKILPATEGQECHDNAAAMAGEMARAWHNESTKTLNPETLAYADKLYKVYLEEFPDAEDFGETQYYYAELLWSRAENEKNPRLQTELWENAAIVFTDVVKTNKADKKQIKEAAYAAVLGWKNALNVDPRVKAPPPDDSKAFEKVPEPLPIPDREKKMLAAFDVYINYIKDPKDDELVGMKFLKANIYRRYNHFDEAIPLFEEILTKHKEHETAEYAANLMLDSLNRLQRYDQMIKWVDKLVEDKKFLEGKEDLAERLEILKRTSERKSAEKLQADAKASGDFTQYVACGKKYIEIFNRDPDGSNSDEVLWNAGTCFEEGKSIGAAIQMFEMLRTRFPKSTWAQKALAKLGFNYGRVAWYKESSEMYEEYARRYAGEKDAYDALDTAVFYRKGIGDDAKAIDNTKDFIKKFGAKKQKEAADAFFSLTAIYEKQGDKDVVVDHLRKYIREYGNKGSGDRVVTAYTKIGQILWEQACPVKTVNGSCVKVTRERAIATKGGKKKSRKKGNDQPTQCGPESKIKLSVVRRDERKAKEASQALAKAVSEFEKRNGKTGGDENAALYNYAQARFLQAEQDYEAFLAIKFPTGLDFNPQNAAKAKKSMKRFEEWLGEKTKSATKASSKYEALIFKVKDAANAIAGAARIGQISQNFSDQLFTAEIPNDVRTGPYADDAVEAYCDALTEKAEPLEARSLEAFGACLGKSTELGWFSEWSRLCEKELGQLRPEEYPTASELRSNPDEVAPITDVEPAALKLE